MSSLLPNGKQHFDDNNGRPLVGGRVHYYIPNTSTPKNTWQDEAMTILNTNPIVLDARGECTAWGAGRYRQVVRDQFGNLIWDKIVSDIGAQFAEPEGAALIGFIQSGDNAIPRNLLLKNREIVSVTDFEGADPTGENESDAAIDSAIAQSKAPYFPDGTFLYTGDMDLLYESGAHGPGFIKYDGYTYPASRISRNNYAWMGHFSSWQGAQGIGTRNIRSYTADGVSACRGGFVSGVTLFQMAGKYESSAMRVQRNAGNTSAASAFVTLSMTQRETYEYRGKTVTFSILAFKGEDFSGNDVIARIAYSEEPEQPILNDNGTFTSGHMALESISITPPPSIRPRAAPYYVSFDVPPAAIQCAVTIEVPFSGTAGANDWVHLECGHLVEGKYPGIVEEPNFSLLLDIARGRYESTYPYGMPRGSIVPGGSLADVTRSTSANWAVVFNARFSKKVFPPTFYFYAPNDGQDFRMTDMTSGTSKLGMAFELGSDGSTFTNNHTPTGEGIVYRAHWAAVSLV